MAVKSEWRRRWFVLALVVALGLLVVYLRPAAVRVDVARATRGPMQVTVDEEGMTRVRDRFVITAPVAGRVERIPLHQGDLVQTGTLAARLYPAPLDPRTRAEASAHLESTQAAKRAADARVEQARAAAEQARRSAQRARRLRAAGTLSAEERELAELAEATADKELEAATFAARAADYDVQAARAALLAPGGEETALVATCVPGAGSCMELRSPITGRVLRVPHESERVVAAGEPLVELGDPTQMEIVVDVLSTDAVKVRAGAPVLVEDWGGEGTLHARVRLVEPSGVTKVSALGVEEQRVDVIADFTEVPTPLGDGFRLEARIVVWDADGILKVPSSALFRRGALWNVFVVDGGRARHRDVETGQRNSREVEILRGLKEGELVILHPSDEIGDGVRVTFQ